MDIISEAELNANRAVFDWCVDHVRSCVSSGELEEALRWAALTASTAAAGPGFTGYLASDELEAQVIAVGERLDTPAVRRGPDPIHRRWLHVLSEAYAVFGHTKMCRLWIEADSARHEHSVALLNQRGEVPGNLLQTVQEKGKGRVIRLDAGQTLVARACQLRKLAREEADVVVLHTHMDDVIALAAFAVGGGPPVILVNHADHLFWLGVRIADLVANIRPSGHAWVRDHRGVDRSVILPIPLGEAPAQLNTAECSRRRAEARAMLGIPELARVFLTVGNESKYRPMDGYDFLPAADELLKARKDAHLIAVGPGPAGRWKEVSSANQGRLHALGVVQRTLAHDQAADIYLEGFPVGSLTALLEAALAGLPCVFAPQTTPLPYVSDDIALPDVLRPASPAGYVAEALALLDDPQHRQRIGAAFQREMEAHHCGEGWRGHLGELQRQVPADHALHDCPPPVRIGGTEREFWMRYCRVAPPRGFVRNPVTDLLLAALKRKPESLPRVSGRLLEGLKPYWETVAEKSVNVASLQAQCHFSEAMAARTLRDWRGVWHGALGVLRRHPPSVCNLSLAGALAESLIGPGTVNSARRARRKLAGG